MEEFQGKFTICRKRIGCRVKAIVVIFAILVRVKLPSQVVIGLIFRILKVIFSIRRGLPYIDDGSGNRLLRLEVRHASMHKSHFGLVRTVYYAGAVVAERGIRAPERPEYRRRGGRIVRLGHQLVCNLVDEPAYALAMGWELQECLDLVCFHTIQGR